MIRKIIHCDCDCFYASIEMRDDPRLRGVPVAVGGQPDRRGVIATCNYEARKFGVHSAMASSAALRLCPGLIILPPRMQAYASASRAIHRIFQDYTDLIEPLSLDEAYLDVSASTRCDGSATLMAQEIRARVARDIGITLSAGIAPNKFIAKIASDWNKPNGQFVVTPKEIDAFVRPLPVSKLFGVGKVTAKKLNDAGIDTCEQLRTLTLAQLHERFGRFGDSLYQLCRGIDERPVNPEHHRKSVSVETTYLHDLPDLNACLAELPALHQDLLGRLARVGDEYVITKKFIKVKFANFVSTTVEQQAQDSRFDCYPELCEVGFRRGNRPVRLLGLGVGVCRRDELARKAVVEQLVFEF